MKVLYDLEAHNNQRNVHRFYRIGITQDLFQTLLVCTQNGRVGTYGRVRHYPVGDEAEAQGLIQKLLKRREGAKKRIGVGYLVVINLLK